MEERRTQTLQALEEFIETQRSFLRQTQADLEKLQQLRNEIVDTCDTSLEHLHDKLNDSSYRLSEQLDGISIRPDNVDWSLYSGHDPTPLKALASDARLKHAERYEPPTTQQSPLSDLQMLVKEARRTILDPILNQLPPPDDISEPDEELDPEELKRFHEELERERAREKIRELKRRQIHSGLTIPLGVRSTRGGVFVRTDVEDESGEVDISVDDPGLEVSDRLLDAPMDVDEPVSSTSKSVVPSRTELPKSPRLRRAPKKAKIEEVNQSTIPVKEDRTRRKPMTETKIKQEPKVPAAAPVSASANQKPKPETYKQAWSVSEQRLLEKLLDEIPDGEKNRWQKISQAMEGRRTPRQVASRVQKYFEKLKRFGIGMDAGASGALSSS